MFFVYIQLSLVRNRDYVVNWETIINFKSCLRIHYHELYPEFVEKLLNFVRIFLTLISFTWNDLKNKFIEAIHVW